MDPLDEIDRAYLIRPKRPRRVVEDSGSLDDLACAKALASIWKKEFWADGAEWV